MRIGSCWPPASIVRSSTLATCSPAPIIITIASIPERASATDMVCSGGAPMEAIWSSSIFMFGSRGIGGA